ncbi:response regulator [Chloroflexota bacterium]
MEKIRILIVDDYPVVREGLRTMLSTDQTIEIAGEASDGAEAVTMVAEKKPNVVLMNIRMSNMDGIEAIRRIKDKHSSTSIIVSTTYDTEAYVIDAIRAGASGYLLKDTSRELLLHTVQTVSSGATLFKANLLYQAISSLVAPKNEGQKSWRYTTEGLMSLTPREQGVLKLVVGGYANKQIGEELSYSGAMTERLYILVNLSANLTFSLGLNCSFSQDCLLYKNWYLGFYGKGYSFSRGVACLHKLYHFLS